MKEAQDYKELHKTIAILIIDFEIQEMKEIEELNCRWVIKSDREPSRILTEKLEIRIIEIPKAKRLLKEDYQNEIAQWMMFLDNPNSVEVSKIMKENEEIKEAVNELEEVSQDEELRRIAFLKEKYKHDEAQAKTFYTEQGLKQGRKEAKFQIVKNMAKEGMNIDVIIKITGLSEEEIRKILENC